MDKRRHGYHRYNDSGQKFRVAEWTVPWIIPDAQYRISNPSTKQDYQSFDSQGWRCRCLVAQNTGTSDPKVTVLSIEKGI